MDSLIPAINLDVDASAELDIGQDALDDRQKYMHVPRSVLQPWSCPGGTAGQVLTADCGGPAMGRKWKLRRISAAAYPFTPSSVTGSGASLGRNTLSSNITQIAGIVTNPTAGQVITSISASTTPSGLYRCTVTCSFGATPGTQVQNFRFWFNGNNSSGYINVPLVTNASVTVDFPLCYVTGIQALQITAPLADTGVYQAQIIATPVSSGANPDMQVILYPGGFSEISTPGTMPGELVWTFIGGLPYNEDFAHDVIDVVYPMHVWAQLAFNTTMTGSIVGSLSVIDEPRYPPVKDRRE